jgi:DNA mismatch endonuclease, patch repair protein
MVTNVVLFFKDFTLIYIYLSTRLILKKYPENKIIVPRFNEDNGFYTTEQRSNIMGKIKSKDTKPEIKFRKALWKLGIRFRKNYKNIPGCPDIVITKFKIVIFIDGEFWHGFKWEEKKLKIKSNKEFWIPKIERNMQRDLQNKRMLIEDGWIVFRFWENEIKKNLNGCIFKITNQIEIFQIEKFIKNLQ